MMRREPGRSKSERGSVLVIASAAMLGVLLAVGLAVDISHFYLAKTELQNAADAAALAAASAINSTPGGIAEGTRRAIQAMNKYEFNKNNVQFTAANVVWAANLDGPYLNSAAASAVGVVDTIRFVQVTSEDSPDGVRVLLTSMDLSPVGFMLLINVLLLLLGFTLYQTGCTPVPEHQQTDA